MGSSQRLIENEKMDDGAECDAVAVEPASTLLGCDCPIPGKVYFYFDLSTNSYASLVFQTR